MLFGSVITARVARKPSVITAQSARMLSAFFTLAKLTHQDGGEHGEDQQQW